MLHQPPVACEAFALTPGNRIAEASIWVIAASFGIIGTTQTGKAARIRRPRARLKNSADSVWVVRRIDVKKLLIISIAVTGLTLLLSIQSHAQQPHSVSPQQATKNIKIISSAGARALADACSAWAEQNKQVVAMAVLDWGGNLVESHAMEGAPMNAIDTALLKAKSALRWRRPTSETNKMVRSGQNLAPTFMRDFPQPGALPIVVDGQVVGAMGVSGADGEKCAQAAIDAVFKGQATSSAAQ
jgi:glc operon protein GlcG